MIIPLSIAADQHSVSFKVTKLSISVEAANLLTLRSPNTIIAIGETAESLQRSKPTEWSNVQHQASFVPAFDRNNFNPEYAKTFMFYYLLRIHQQVRPSFSGLWRLVDRFDCALSFSGYATINAERRQAFETLLQRLPLIGRLNIQG